MSLNNLILGIIVIIFVLNSKIFTQQIVIGKGSYTETLPAGETSPPSLMYVTENVRIPNTTSWWSSIISSRWSYPHFAFPLAFNFEESSDYGCVFIVRYPDNIVASRDTIFAGFGTQGLRFRFRKRNGEYIRPQDIRVDSYSDWTVTPIIIDSTSQDYCKITYGQGLVFVYFEFSDGIDVVEVEFEAPLRNLFDVNNNTISLNNYVPIEVIGVELSKSNSINYYGFFMDQGATAQRSGNVLYIRLPSEVTKKYISCALMTKREDISFFYNYAYAFVKDAKVFWSYNEKTAEVITKFEVETVSKRLNQVKTLLALFPHQWKNIVEALNFSQEYTTLRGKLKLIEGNIFHTKLKFNGVIPFLPDCGEYNRSHLLQLLQRERDTLLLNPGANDDDTYFTGKRLAKVANMIPIADSLNAQDVKNYLINRLRNALVNWFTYSAGESDCFFYYDNRWKGLIGYNPSFGSENFSDHHFHYGYFIYASAILSIYDKEFLRDYGGMVELLIRDIASPYRNDPMFPFLRCMDPYEGHSWADGVARFYDGNNQESTSEAMNAWSGIILWGLVSGNTTYRDLGIWGYVTEYSAIREYWFDVDREIFTKYPAYQHHMASIVWGGKVDHATWFSGAPECIHGIQYIPVTACSLYLSYDISWARADYEEMIRENGGQLENERGWHSIIWKFQAMFDTSSVISKYQENPEFLNDGDTWSHVYHFIHNFAGLGQVITEIFADYPSFGVFIKDDLKTYVVYNFEMSTKCVNFYDRKDNRYLGSILVPPNSMAWTRNLLFLNDQPPKIIDVSLNNGATVSGIVDIFISVLDDFGVRSIELYIDNVKVDEWEGSVSSFVYTYTLNTTLYLNGVHTMKVVIKDISLQETMIERNFFVNNQTHQDNGTYNKEISLLISPNPFNPFKEMMKIELLNYQGKEAPKIRIYSLSGKLVKELNFIRETYKYLSLWDGRDALNKIVPNGVYICEVKYGKKRFYKKIVCIR